MDVWSHLIEILAEPSDPRGELNSQDPGRMWSDRFWTSFWSAKYCCLVGLRNIMLIFESALVNAVTRCFSVKVDIRII